MPLQGSRRPQSGKIPGVDHAYHEEVRGRLLGLFISIEARLPAEGRGFVSELIDVGEYGLALETMADLLSEHVVPITAQERGETLALVSRMDMDEQVPTSLALCPQRT